MDLSIIVPFVNEFPMIVFTLQSINQALLNKGIEYEVIGINNYCDEVKNQGREEDNGNSKGQEARFSFERYKDNFEEKKGQGDTSDEKPQEELREHQEETARQA